MEVDFEEETFALAQSVSEEIPFDNTVTADINLSNDLGISGSDKPLFLVLGIEFVKEVNGMGYSID